MDLENCLQEKTNLQDQLENQVRQAKKQILEQKNQIQKIEIQIEEYDKKRKELSQEAENKQQEMRGTGLPGMEEVERQLRESEIFNSEAARDVNAVTAEMKEMRE